MKWCNGVVFVAAYWPLYVHLVYYDFMCAHKVGDHKVSGREIPKLVPLPIAWPFSS